MFYDLQQQRLGSCADADIALVVACPVVSKQPQTRTLVVHGGAVHFSKDTAPRGPHTPDRVYAQAMAVSGSPADGAAPPGCSVAVPPGRARAPPFGPLVEGVYLVYVSQEHGLVQFDACAQALFEATGPGDVLYLAPAHSCLAVACFTEVRVCGGGLEALPTINHWLGSPAAKL